MKIPASILFSLLLVCSGGFAATGILSGEKDLQVIQTRWFDIIFPASSLPSASVLAENADRIYQEIADDYGIPPKLRFPVVITPAVEAFNAYFSWSPYNRIVLYDTAPVDSLSVFSETLLSVFTHELTHAYTYNLKGPFFTAMGNIFGDIVNPGLWTITLGWAEGSTLTQESLKGEGRLNSGFSLQMVRQALIEDAFPAYADVQGARDTYPTGSFYNFNGSFNQWLQDTYGMKKYAEFWYACVNFEAVLAGQAFKRVYGISINEAWGRFRDALEFPPVEPNPVAAGEAEDFFQPEGEDFSPDNSAGFLYASLGGAKDELVWMDSATQAVFTATADSQGQRKPRRLFTMEGIQDISLSCDGRFLVVELLSGQQATPKLQLKIYDRESGRFTTASRQGRSNGAVICRGGEYFFVCTEYQNLCSRILVYRLLVEGKKLELVPYREGEFQRDTFYRDFISLEDGRMAFITNHRNQFTVTTADLELSQIRRVQFPHAGAEIRHLSHAGGSLLFSWATKETLPRLGVYSLTGEYFSLQGKDISGGIQYPVALGAGQVAGSGQAVAMDEIYFVGTFYTQNRLLVSDSRWLDMETYGNDGVAETAETGTAAGALSASADISLQFPAALLEDGGSTLAVARYNPLNYYTQGIFLPFGLVNTKIITPDGRALASSMGWGLTFMTSNPWMADFLILSLGFSSEFDPTTLEASEDVWESLSGMVSESFRQLLVGYSISYQNGTSTSLFKWNVTHNSVFSVRRGWDSSTLELGVSSYLPFGRISAVSLANSSHLQFRRDTLGQNLFSFLNTSGAIYSNVHQWGPHSQEKLGIMTGLELSYTNISSLAGPVLRSYWDLGLFLTAYLPRLLPIQSPQNHLFNLPTKLRLDLLTLGVLGATASSDIPLLQFFSGQNGSTLRRQRIASLSTETILYSLNVQKAIPVITAVYVNDLGFSMLSSAGFEDYSPMAGSSWRVVKLDEYLRILGTPQAPWFASLGVRATLGLTPNIGILANSSQRGQLYVEFAGLFSPRQPGLSVQVGFSGRF